MRVLIAGGSGAIGRPLLRSLMADRRTVFAPVRSPQSATAVAALGAEPVIADASTKPRSIPKPPGSGRMR